MNNSSVYKCDSQTNLSQEIKPNGTIPGTPILTLILTVIQTLILILIKFNLIPNLTLILTLSIILIVTSFWNINMESPE